MLPNEDKIAALSWLVPFQGGEGGGGMGEEKRSSGTFDH